VITCKQHMLLACSSCACSSTLNGSTLLSDASLLNYTAAATR
jgi:hypothetical protein